MDPSSSAISASILTAAYLGKESAEMDRYMAVYADFLKRIESWSEGRQTRQDEAQRRKPSALYEYKKTT